MRYIASFKFVEPYQIGRMVVDLVAVRAIGAVGGFGSLTDHGIDGFCDVLQVAGVYYKKMLVVWSATSYRWMEGNCLRPAIEIRPESRR